MESCSSAYCTLLSSFALCHVTPVLQFQNRPQLVTATALPFDERLSPCSVRTFCFQVPCQVCPAMVIVKRRVGQSARRCRCRRCGCCGRRRCGGRRRGRLSTPLPNKSSTACHQQVAGYCWERKLITHGGHKSPRAQRAKTTSPLMCC